MQAQRQLTHKGLAQAVVSQMGLTQADYARQVADYGAGKRRNEEAFQNLIEYRLYEDLQKGWRIVQPNLEQCGLLVIEYEELESVCQATDLWKKYPHPILLQATPKQRHTVIRAVLDQLRKELVLDAALLQPQSIERLKRGG